jgi:hypothetical protein
VQLLQLLRWLEAEFFDENRARGPESLERVGLASRTIERQHELGSKPLAVGVLGCERLKLRHELVVAMQRDVRVDSSFDREETELVDPFALDWDERSVLHVGQWNPAMQVECLSQRRGGATRVLRPGAFDQPGEAIEVELVRVELESVAPALRLDALGR